MPPSGHSAGCKSEDREKTPEDKSFRTSRQTFFVSRVFG